MKKTNSTHFASPERTEKEELLRQKSIFDNLPELSFFLAAIPNIYLILNNNRQVVYANKTALDSFGFSEIGPLLGMRPGEAINCQHSDEMEAGCGTSEACKHCGAVNAILAGLNHEKDIREFRTTTGDNESTFDYRVWTTPYKISGEDFVLFALDDISHEKRRKSLERIFFHDVLNTAGGIKGISSLIHEFPEEVHDFKDILYDSSNQLINEILTQRDLANAENNELSVVVNKLNSKSIVKFLFSIFSKQEQFKKINILINPDIATIDFESDETLILRVLSNIVKNALEASTEGQTVTINCSQNADKVIFSVHNQRYMQGEVQLQIFQRSFTTKGEGRGLGTYSMKLLSERYLGGKVYFTSDEMAGTTFFAEYPLIISA